MQEQWRMEYLLYVKFFNHLDRVSFVQNKVMASKRREILWCIFNLVPRAFYFEFAPPNFKEKSPGNEVSSVHFFGIEWKLSYKYYMCVTPSVTFRTNKKIRKNSIAEIYTPRAGVSKEGGREGHLWRRSILSSDQWVWNLPFHFRQTGSLPCFSDLQIDFHLFGRLNGIEKDVMISLSLIAKCRSISQSWSDW